MATRRTKGESYWPIRNMSHTILRTDRRISECNRLSYPPKAGYPVRWGFPVYPLTALIYWIALLRGSFLPWLLHMPILLSLATLVFIATVTANSQTAAAGFQSPSKNFTCQY